LNKKSNIDLHLAPIYLLQFTKHPRSTLASEFGRLELTQYDYLDEEMSTNVDTTTNNERVPVRRQRVRNFSGRDFTCGNFRSAILRGSDFRNANMVGDVFDKADMRGAFLEGAQRGLKAL
jgi:hypothetical protein